MPLLFDAFECLLGDARKKQTREQLSAEILILNYLEGLLQDVETSANLQRWSQFEGAQALDYDWVVCVV